MAACPILGWYVSLMSVISLPILVASMIIYRGNGFPTGGIELPILWALVQVAQALLRPGSLRAKAPDGCRPFRARPHRGRLSASGFRRAREAGATGRIAVA